MRNSKMIVGIVLFIAILLVAVGYAAISATGLNISGNLSATANDENFKVKFTGKPTVSDTKKVNATIVDDLNATINVQGLTTRGDKESARYTVINESADLSAELTAEIKTNTNTEYFDVTYEIEEPDILKAGESTTILVTVELLKTPITNDVSTTIKVEVTAEPKQPETTPIPPDISEGDGASPSEIFDATGELEDKLHIGDFVNYDAGVWTQGEIDDIEVGLKTSPVRANGTSLLPTKHMEFGGFSEGSSRNGNATPNTSYNLQDSYIKDESGNAVTGWRIFDIEGDNVTLISAGNPEDYYHGNGGADCSYQSEYILTGNVNGSWSDGATEAEKYQKRIWNNYINTAQKATNATALTKTRLDSWYSKYIMDGVTADVVTIGTFQKIYQEPYIKYQNMIENYSLYWLSEAYSSRQICNILPNSRYVNFRETRMVFGVRILVSLRTDVKFTPKKIGTKTLTGGNMDTYGGEQTYNVWGIK